MWDDHVTDYLDTMSSPATRQAYGRALTRFEIWYRQTYGEEPEAALLTDQEARDWRAYLLGVRGYAASTVNVRLSALNGVVSHAGGRLDVNLVKQVMAPIDPLTGRELGRLVRAVEQHTWGPCWLPPRNVAMISVMARAGLRVSEVVQLDLADVELRERSGWAAIRQGKGLKARQVPLSLQCRKDLQAYLEERPDGHGRPALFIGRGSLERLVTRSVQNMVSRAAQRAGIEKDCTPHTLRHTFATRFLSRGGDLPALQRILGHANLQMTARYVHPTADQMQRMVEAL